jgi:K(+)-stimulated pyrophosphate-energized sodium pump
MTIDSLQKIFFGGAIAGFAMIVYLYLHVIAIKVKDKRAAKIAGDIQSGAMTFLKEEYKIICAASVAIALVLYFVTHTFAIPAAFLAACFFSMLTGFIGMRSATEANVRTTIAAKEQGEAAALKIAFFGGGVMGFAVASFGLFGMGALFYLYYGASNFTHILTAFAAGCSLVAFFARIGGGIFTKAADVGADLVGKIEAGIPEDDPRNPAVIADNVGDCVGDTAGMGADIFESYAGAMASSVILALNAGLTLPYITLPVMLSVLGLAGSIIGLAISFSFKQSPAALLRNATYISIVGFLAAAYVYMSYANIEIAYFYTVIVGCLAGVVIGIVTEYYTAGKPVENIARSSESGAATNLIYGLSVGMESTVVPVLLLSIGVLAAHSFGGLFGISLAAVAMLATVGITMTVDSYGPIADNAGGIAEMAGFGPEVRKITDGLDALGNTTAAMGKGFAIGSALMTSIALFSAFAEEAGLIAINVLDPYVLVGVFIGGVMPFLISSLTMRAVGDAALQMVMEVRHQFQTIKGIMTGDAEPDYERCIAIATKASLAQMIAPGVLSVLVPVAVRYGLGVEALGGMLVGATVVGVLLALMMANGGGAWDNAKKLIEAGAFGGKGSPAHKAAIVGDTVGDPFKDTSGPALNILIKLMAIVSLLLVMK